jgi:rubrerythrin
MDEDNEEPDDDITTANSGSHNYNAPSTTSAVSSGRNISSNSSKTTSSSIGMHSVEEEMAYEPPTIPISDLLDPHSTVFADTLMEIMNATLSNGDNNMNHNGTTIMNHDKVDDDSSSDDSYHGIFHSNFPVVIDARNDNHIHQMITAVVTEDELRKDEEYKQQAIASYKERQQKILIESQNRVIDYSSEGWGNMFDQMYEGKWKCNSCRVYNEEKYTKCPACETPRETSTIDTSNSNSTTTNAIISPSSIAATAPSLFVFSAAPPVSTSTTAPTTAPAFQFGAPFASSTTNNNNRETNATTSTSSLSSTAFVFNTNTADGGFTFGTTKVVPSATNGDTKPYVNPSLSVPTPPAPAPAPTAFVFGASSSASAGSATTIPTPTPTFVFGASSSTANSSGGTTTNSAPAPSSVASPFVFGNASTNSATEIAALPSTNGSTTTGTNAPTFSFSTGSIDINNAPSSQPIDTTGTAVKPTFEPFKFDNTTGSSTSIASTPAPFAFSSKLPSASSADANTFGTTPPVVPTFGSNVNNANTGTDSTSQTSNTESVTTANDVPRPFVFGAATNNSSSTSAPTVPTMFATSANQPFAVPQNKPPETFVFGSSNNQKAQSIPPPATLQSGQPTNGSNMPTALPPASVSAPPVQPLFGNPSAPSTTATPSAVPLFGNNAAPPLFGNHVASTHAPAPTGAFVFGSSSNNNTGIVPPQSSNTIQAPNNRFGAESAPLANPFAASASNPFTPLGQPGTNATNTTFGSTNSFMGTSSSGMDAMSSDTFAQPAPFGQNAAMTFGNPAVSNAPIAPPFNGGVIGTGTVNQIPTPAFGATMPSGEQGGFSIGTGTHAAKTTVQRRVIKARRPK